MIHYFALMDKAPRIESLQDLFGHNRRIKILHSTAELYNKIKTTERAVILLGESINYEVYELCQEITHLFPMTAIVLVLSKEAIDYKKGMFSGAVDVIDMNNQEEWISAVEKANQIIQLKSKRQGSSDLKEGKVITFCSTKGGVGKSALTVNIAVAFLLKEFRVAVIDLDLQFGDITLLLNQKPNVTIYEWIKEGYESGVFSIDDYVTKDKAGIDILASPYLPEYAELVTGEHVYTLIQEMKKKYDIIIIDTPPSFVETTLVALENADEILLITSLDLPALKNGKLAVDTLNVLGLKERIKVVLNRDSEFGELTTEMVEEVLGMDIRYRIPSDYKLIIASINKGIPFVTMAPRVPVSKAVFQLADELLGESKIELERKRKKRFWKKKRKAQ
ncbi:AAA family ATPase [Bacillus massilinigeriensis]|uniref:AAA family ATPase n=1 Tax=Bacillus massilionigeriensis TaxID=1805475 RepID=UPI00096AFCD3|nr:AAA family ATPase [Bacillus massilionigeriensis]